MHGSRPVTATLLSRSGACVIASLLLVSSGADRAEAQGTAKTSAVAERAAESRYHGMLKAEPATAVEWFRIADWCELVSRDLSPRSRQVFHERSEEARIRARKIMMSRLRTLIDSATNKLQGAATHAQALQLRDETEEQAKRYLELLIPFLQIGKERSFLTEIEASIKRLDSLVEPIGANEMRDKVAQGLVPIDGKWISLIEATDDYHGLRPLHEIMKAPRKSFGAVATEFASSLRLFEILDLCLLDGFDKKGSYIVPNFMDERLVLSISKSIKNHLLNSSAVKSTSVNRTSDEENQLFRVKVVLNIRPRQKQFVHFYAGTVEFISIFDANDKMVDFFIPERRSSANRWAWLRAEKKREHCPTPKHRDREQQRVWIPTETKPSQRGSGHSGTTYSNTH